MNPVRSNLGIRIKELEFRAYSRYNFRLHIGTYFLRSFLYLSSNLFSSIRVSSFDVDEISLKLVGNAMTAAVTGAQGQLDADYWAKQKLG